MGSRNTLCTTAPANPCYAPLLALNFIYPHPPPHTHTTPSLCQADVVRSRTTLHMAAKHITGELHAAVKALLGKGTREDMVAWLANAINGNKERAKMQEDISVSFCRLS